MSRAQALLGAAVLAAAGSCASSEKEAAGDVWGFATPSVFTRVDIARNYRATTADPIAVAADGDASFAAAHEDAVGARDFGSESSGALYLRAASELPRGWTAKGADLIRHTLSGLECPRTIEIEDENRRFLLVGVHEFGVRNLDVGCAYLRGEGDALTLYASFWPQMALEDSTAGAVAAIRQRFSVKGELPIALISLDGEGPAYNGLEEPVAGGFDIGVRNGKPYKTSLWLVKTQGWHVKARATYAQDDVSSELVSAILFAVSHVNVRAKNLAEPVAAGGEV
jgi:hypothetical protein